MGYNHDSRRNCASQMKREQFFSEAHSAMPLSTVNCQLSIVNCQLSTVNCPIESHLRSFLLHQENACNDNDDSENLV